MTTKPLFSQNNPPPRSYPSSRNTKKSVSFEKQYLQRNDQHSLTFDESNFPPLCSKQDDKINELSTAVRQVQSCLEFLIRKQNNSQTASSNFGPQSYGVNQQPSYTPQQMYNLNHTQRSGQMLNENSEREAKN